MNLAGYRARNAFILDCVKGKTVLHLGCVGETEGSLEHRVRAAKPSFRLKRVK